RHLDPPPFKKELAAVFTGFASLATAEFLVTAIEVARDATPSALTTIRFDLVGPAKAGGHAEGAGHWRLAWNKASDGSWQIAEWSALDYVRSRAPAPVFTEVTEAVLGRNTP